MARFKLTESDICHGQAFKIKVRPAYEKFRVVKNVYSFVDDGMWRIGEDELSTEPTLEYLDTKDFLSKLNSLAFCEKVDRNYFNTNPTHVKEGEVKPMVTIDPLPIPKEALIKTPSYYDNSKGSLYKVAQDRGWNAYLFDAVKRLERGGKKDPLHLEIDKTIALLQLWKEEIQS